MSEGNVPLHSCPSSGDGLCPVHDVEVERRNTDRNRLEDLRKEFREFKKVMIGHIGDLCTFKNRMLGLGVLGTIVVLGNYGWTSMVKAELQGELEKASDQIEGHKISTETKFAAVLLQVSNNRTEMAVVASQISTTNDRLREVINLMERDRRDLQRDKAERNGNQ